MIKFLIKGSYTSDGVKGLLKAGGTTRKQAVEKMINGVGGKMEAFYYAFGEHDVYAIAELPDSVTIAAIGLTINASGMVSSSITILLTTEEIDRASKKSVNYRPPGA